MSDLNVMSSLPSPSWAKGRDCIFHSPLLWVFVLIINLQRLTTKYPKTFHWT